MKHRLLIASVLLSLCVLFLPGCHDKPEDLPELFPTSPLPSVTETLPKNTEIDPVPTDTTAVSDPEWSPDDMAHPLLWHASSPNGGELWLLGTIHLGDSRTSHLPDTLMGYFDQAEALAVECDVLDVMEHPARYSIPMARVMAYSDFSPITDHISPDLYQAGKERLQEYGMYMESLDYMKPMVWVSFLEEVYTNQIPGLTSDNGVDMQLLQLAKDQGKEILEIESVMGQYEMLFGFSDELQAYLLQDMLDTTPESYSEEVLHLYDAWIHGDSDALEEAVLSDEEISDPELDILMEEYNQAMVTNRNALMASTAVSYLNEGRQVFFAVGCAHMLGDSGIIAILTDLGYAPELISY